MPDTYGGYAWGRGEYAGPPVANSPFVSVNGGAFPTKFVEIAPGYGPNDAAPVWVNIAADVTQIQTRRGRQRILSRFEAGTMSVTVDNKSGRYSPFNPSSPYYNQIVPGMPIRFRALWGAVTYTEFSGFVESWPLVWPSAADSTVTISAVDAMKFLNLKKATSIDAYAQTIAVDAPYLWYRAGDPIGSTTMADSGSAGLSLPIHYQSGWPYLVGAPQAVYGNPTFQAAGALVADTNPAVDLGTGGAAFGGVLGGSLPASFAANAAITVEAWYKSNQGTGQTTTIGGVTDSVGGGGVELRTDIDGNAAVAVAAGTTNSTVRINDGQWHHLVAAASSSTVLLYVDGVQVVSTSRGTDSFSTTNVAVGGHTYGPDPSGVIGFTGGSIDEFAVYRSTLSTTQVATHYVAATEPRYGETTGARIAYLAGYTAIPTSMEVIDTGQTVVQGASDKWLTGTILANMQDQADTEDGALFIDAAGRLTFFDRLHTSRSPYSSVSLILGDSGAAPEEPYRLDTLTVSYDDQDVYNEITITPENLAPQTASDATSQSQYGKRTQTSTSMTSTVADAAARAAARLALFKTPQPRVDAVTVVPTDDPTMLFGPVLGFDLLTRVELRRRPKDGSGSTFDQTALIEGIEHRVTKATWETTWRLGVPS